MGYSMVLNRYAPVSAMSFLIGSMPYGRLFRFDTVGGTSFNATPSYQLHFVGAQLTMSYRAYLPSTLRHYAMFFPFVELSPGLCYRFLRTLEVEEMVNRDALVFRGTFTLGWQIWRGLDVYASFGLLSELRF